MKEILKYEVGIPTISRWTQDLLGYHFSILHRSNKMMSDISALTRRSWKLIAQYCIVVSILYSTDKHQRPKAYKELIFTKDNTVKISSDVSQQILKLILLMTSIMMFFNKIRNMLCPGGEVWWNPPPQWQWRDPAG